MARSAIRRVLLDLDGTLLDTAPDMAAALNRLRTEHGAASPSSTMIRPHVSHGAAALVRLGFPECRRRRVPALRARFLDVYASDIADATTVFPGFEPVLAELEARELPWGIVTNKPAFLTDAAPRALRLATERDVHRERRHRCAAQASPGAAAACRRCS